MSEAVTETAKYVIFPLLAPAIGAAIALRNNPNEQLKSLVRHIAGGLVFAAATVELLPQLLKDKQPLATIIGFCLGVGLLLLVNVMLGGHYHGDKDETDDHTHVDKDGKSPLGTMVAATSIDVAVDGLLIGLGFSIGLTAGRLLTLALTLEMLFIGLALISSCRDRSISTVKAFFIAASPGLILAAMAFVGVSIVSNLHGALHQGVLAFGIAALLYLVTEELLVEAHESPDEPVEVAGFFLGFLVVLALALL